MKADRPRLLMVSPVLPALSGNGLAMRAAMSLRALAHHYRVSLLVLPFYISPADQRLPAELRVLCDEVQVGLRGVDKVEITPSSPGPLAGSFDVIHVFRLACLPAARRWFDAAGEIHLDLDDVESVSRPRIAALYRELGRMREASVEEHAAHEALLAEIDALISFDRVYVCSDEDREQLPFCGPAEVRVLPNVVDIPPDLEPQTETDDPFTFLFVGNLSYLPNAEGLSHFTTAVLPLLRQAAPGPFRIQIAGFGASQAIRDLAKIPEVEVIGPVPDVAPWYAQANAVIVPIRAGGGTRIKVLEAFAFRRPIVSTTIGIEGIEARHDVHALLADQPDDFAAACQRLMADSTLRNRLADRAFQLVRKSYSLDSMVSAVAPDVRRPLPR